MRITPFRWWEIAAQAYLQKFGDNLRKFNMITGLLELPRLDPTIFTGLGPSKHLIRAAQFVYTNFTQLNMYGNVCTMKQIYLRPIPIGVEKLKLKKLQTFLSSLIMLAQTLFYSRKRTLSRPMNFICIFCVGWFGGWNACVCRLIEVHRAFSTLYGVIQYIFILLASVL